ELERVGLELAEKRDREMQIALRRRTAARAPHGLPTRALDRAAGRIVRPEREEDAATGGRLGTAGLVRPRAAGTLGVVDPRDLPLRLAPISSLGLWSARRARRRLAARRAPLRRGDQPFERALDR